MEMVHVDRGAYLTSGVEGINPLNFSIRSQIPGCEPMSGYRIIGSRDRGTGRNFMIPKALQHILSTDPEVMGGAICFTGTRIPVQTLLDNLLAAIPIEVILDAYPSLTRDVIQEVINWEDEQARDALGIEQAL